MSYRTDLKAKADAGDTEAAKKLEELKIKQREAKRRSRAKRAALAAKGDAKAIKAIETEKKNNKKARKAFSERQAEGISAGDKKAIARKNATDFYTAKYNLMHYTNLTDLKKIQNAIDQKRKILEKNAQQN